MKNPRHHDAAYAARIAREVEQWLPPLIAGGLSAARSAPIGATAERLAETIVLALQNTILGRPHRFSEQMEEPPFGPIDDTPR